MLFQITGTGWPVTGDKLIPAGTILNFDDPTDMQAQWAKKSGMLRVNTLCLDAEAFAYASALYPPYAFGPNQRPRLLDGVVVKEQP